MGKEFIYQFFAVSVVTFTASFSVIGQHKYMILKKGFLFFVSFFL